MNSKIKMEGKLMSSLFLLIDISVPPACHLDSRPSSTTNGEWKERHLDLFTIEVYGKVARGKNHEMNPSKGRKRLHMICIIGNRQANIAFPAD